MPLIECIQGDETWHGARKGKLTASIAAACLGLDDKCSRQRAWRIIMGRETDAEIRGDEYLERMYEHGNTFESHARRSYEIETGNLVETTGFWTHPTIPWLGASPDGLIGSEGGLECKCPISKLPAELPMAHRIQCLVNMACTERKWWDYIAWMRTETMGRDGILVKGEAHYLDGCFAGELPDLLNDLHAFWISYVVTGTEPPKKARKKKLPKDDDTLLQFVRGDFGNPDEIGFPDNMDQG